MMTPPLSLFPPLDLSLSLSAVPPTIAPLFLVVCVNVTEEVILRCEAEASGNGTDMEWEWRVNGSEVVPSGRLLFDRSGLVRVT